MPRAIYDSPEEIPTGKWIEHPYRPGVLLPVHRRSMRAPDVDYTARGCRCFVTYRLLVREPLLTRAVGETAWNAFLEEWQRRGFVLHTACMMPDHMHALLAPSGEGDSVSDIVRSLKLCQANRVRAKHDIWLRWQPSFYDHVLRSPDRKTEIEAISHYITENPIRAGLANAHEYPFTHSRAGATPPAANAYRTGNVSADPVVTPE